MRAWVAGNLMGIAELAYIRAQVALWRFDYAAAARWLNVCATIHATAYVVAPRGRS